MAAGLLTVPLMNQLGWSIKVTGIVLVLCLEGLAIHAGLYFGGVIAPAFLMIILTPLIGFFSSGRFGAKICLVFSLLGLVGLLIAQHYGWVAPFPNIEKYTGAKALVVGAMLVGAYAIGAAYEHSRDLSYRMVEDVMRKSAQTAKMSSLTEMASSVAHEINNPLAIIHGKTGQLREMLEQEGSIDPAKLSRELIVLENTAMRIAKIVKGMRLFSRDSMLDPIELIKVAPLVTETVDLCRQRADAPGIDFRVHCPSEIEFAGRSGQISLALLNLLVNSIEAISANSQRWISVRVAGVDGWVRIEVTDSGQGVLPEVADKMMLPFFTTKVFGSGTGLGLSVSMGIAESHGGRLFYDEKKPNTSFVLELPVAQERVSTSVGQLKAI